MVDDHDLNAWFCTEILTLEPTLTAFIQRNWRQSHDVPELRQDIYERALSGARIALPANARAYLFTIARNHIINRAMRSRIVSFELVADLESVDIGDVDLLATERHLDARDDLRRAQRGLEALPPRCREVVRLRKFEGFTTRETAERLGVGIDAIEQQLTLGMRALTDFMLGGSGKLRRPRPIRRFRSNQA